MSITVADCLNMTALYDAKVLGGRSGLGNIVASVSVIEHVDHNILRDDLFLGNEILITAFACIRNDIDAQCAVIRRLHEVGEVGLILYYVGTFMPTVDNRLIQIADELNFPLICMPNRLNCRYSEAISEITEAIIRDRQQETYFVQDILNRFSQMKEQQRDWDTILGMLSDHLHSTVLLADQMFEYQQIAAWPRFAQWDYNQISLYCKSHYPKDGITHGTISMEGSSFHLSYSLIVGHHKRPLYLIIMTPYTPLSDADFNQAKEVIQLFMNIWKFELHGQNPNNIIRAIINDNPLKMETLVKGCHLDVSVLCRMWILRGSEQVKSGQSIPLQPMKLLIELKAYLKQYHKTVLIDSYGSSIIALMDCPSYMSDDICLEEDFLKQMSKNGLTYTLITAANLANPNDIRDSYILSDNHYRAAQRIYPHKQMFTIHDLKFAKICHDVACQGSDAVSAHCTMLNLLREEDDGHILVETLTTLLLDAHNNLQLAGDLLFVHKNTVKYRLKKIQQKLGYDIMRLPENYNLYYAAALERLIR